LGITCIEKKPLNGSNTYSDCKVVLDSAKIFEQTSEFAINTRPTIKDTERNLRLDKYLQNLSFSELTCLLDDGSISFRALGFIYAAMHHGETLMKSYSSLLRDTTTIQLFMADGSTTPKMRLGEFLTAMREKIKGKDADFSKKSEIENIVSTFIRQYSTYPNTYKPISFPLFSMSSSDGASTEFKTHHDYQIKNNEGVNVRVVNAFVLDKNLKINVIEKDSTSYSYSYPPKLGYWLNEFGRRLGKSDSLMLKLR
jgi:hypothetical protein